MENKTNTLQNIDINYEKPKIIRLLRNNNTLLIRSKKILKIMSVFFMIYVLMLTPVFFLYPNYNLAVKENFDPKWLTNISAKLEGDCFRKTRNFIKECPFPCREVHLNSEHTMVEISINRKWIAYDPEFNMYFNDENVVQLSDDVNRGYIPPCLTNYPFKYSLKKFRYYHNFYFAILNITHPFYYKLLRTYYTVISR